MTQRTFYTAAATVITSEIKTMANGTPYLVARGSIARARAGKEPIERTIKAEGKAMDAIKDAMIPGNVVRIRGFYDKVANAEGETSGEFFVATGLARELKEAA